MTYSLGGILICECGTKTEVYDSKVTEDGKCVWRRRKCPVCNRRFTTHERTPSFLEELKDLLLEQLKDDLKHINKFHAPLIENVEKGDEWEDPVWDEFEKGEV